MTRPALMALLTCRSRGAGNTDSRLRTVTQPYERNASMYDATLEVYRTLSLRPSQRYAWRARAANGRIIACSGEGYTSRAEAQRMGLAVCRGDYVVELAA